MSCCQLDTFLCGTHRELPRNQDPRPEDEKVEDGPLYIVHSRHPSQYGDVKMLQKKGKSMQLLESKIRLKIGSGWFRHDNVEAQSPFNHGCTSRKSTVSQ